ncbi:hypothetical protein [Brumicola pallidula]|uniref:Uncharacterized protein n=1 Tax=Brumicola pallidula DSM 14239 = ACAM 615 TaxID=1121922 RepID=K6ZK28_9ALTE|nr:hypothetical protein [Glaciecola pallidula]GAC30707.1 hypothetical protein GPAL_3867 [Glaciecola pallidula DSM 14239 = ACAM 615]
MNKLFKATPMKKLLLASSILAISSTAIAANTSPLLDTAVTDTLTVTAKYVTPLALGLDTSTINFGDVFTDSVIDVETVLATINGEAGETFTYTIASDGDNVTLSDAGSTLDFADTTEQTLSFDVGLNTTDMTDADTSEIVTFTVKYNAIADTTSDKAAAV